MLEFVTFFFGLVAGAQKVEVTVSEPAAVVELRLDGEAVGVPQGAPWSFEVDFGPSLAPHVLEAVAWGGDGKEIARAQQFLNLPRARAELRIVLGPVAADGSRPGRLVWWCLDGDRPRRVEVTLDGLPLEVRASRAFTLPALEAGGERPQVLSAEADFPGSLTASTSVLLGGRFGDRVSSELTAVPVLLDEGRALPPAEAMAGWLRDGGEALEVLEVESRGAEVVFVRDRGAWDALREMGERFREGRVRRVGTLGGERRLRLLDAFPQLLDDRPVERFPLSQPIREGEGGVPVVVGTFHREHPAELRGRQTRPAQRLADAVAAAGLTVAGSQGPRAVVLVLGRDPADGSQWTASQVRDYLEALGVPLYVWSTVPASVAERSWPEGVAAWGEPREIVDMPRFLAAIAELAGELDRQRVLWVEGRRFLHHLELAPHVRGLRLAG